MTIAARVRAALSAGECHSRDIAEVCGITRRHARSWLYLLVSRGHAERTGRVIRGPAHSPLVLFALTHRGRLAAKRDQKRQAAGA